MKRFDRKITKCLRKLKKSQLKSLLENLSISDFSNELKKDLISSLIKHKDELLVLLLDGISKRIERMTTWQECDIGGQNVRLTDKELEQLFSVFALRFPDDLRKMLGSIQGEIGFRNRINRSFSSKPYNCALILSLYAATGEIFGYRYSEDRSVPPSSIKKANLFFEMLRYAWNQGVNDAGTFQGMRFRDDSELSSFSFWSEFLKRQVFGWERGLIRVCWGSQEIEVNSVFENKLDDLGTDMVSFLECANNCKGNKTFFPFPKSDLKQVMAHLEDVGKKVRNNLRKTIHRPFEKQSQKIKNIKEFGKLIKGLLDKKLINQLFTSKKHVPFNYEMQFRITLEPGCFPFPLELAIDNNRMLSELHCVSRILPENRFHERRLKPERDINVLIVSSFGEDLQFYDFETVVFTDLLSASGSLNDKMLIKQTWNCTKEEFLKEISVGEYDIVHFSCHGGFDVDGPYLLLHKHEKLRPQDLGAIQIKDPPSLIFMNACDTAVCDLAAPLPNLENEMGFNYGLANAFVEIGAISVIGSIWPISDRTAGLFCAEFYKNCLLRRFSINKSVAMAKRDLWNHPLYSDCAGFILFSVNPFAILLENEAGVNAWD